MADYILTNNIDSLLTQAEVEKITGLKPSTLEQWRLKGKGPAWVKLGTRTVRYKQSAIIDYLNSLKGDTND